MWGREGGRVLHREMPQGSRDGYVGRVNIFYPALPGYQSAD